MGFRGVPYRLGGADPGGFDCSGLVQYVFAQYGIAVPRVVEQQYEVGDTIRPSDIKPGDLIFFNTKKSGDGASHVAIAIGAGQLRARPELDRGRPDRDARIVLLGRAVRRRAPDLPLLVDRDALIAFTSRGRPP